MCTANISSFVKTKQSTLEMHFGVLSSHWFKGTLGKVWFSGQRVKGTLGLRAAGLDGVVAGLPPCMYREHTRAAMDTHTHFYCTGLFLTFLSFLFCMFFFYDFKFRH